MLKLTTHDKYCISNTTMQHVRVEDRYLPSLFAWILLRHSMCVQKRGLIFLNLDERHAEIQTVSTGCRFGRTQDMGCRVPPSGLDRYEHRIPISTFIYLLHSLTCLTTTTGYTEDCFVDNFFLDRDTTKRLVPIGDEIRISSSVIGAVRSQLGMIYDCMALHYDSAGRRHFQPLADTFSNWSAHGHVPHKYLNELFERLVDLHLVDLPLTEAKQEERSRREDGIPSDEGE